MTSTARHRLVAMSLVAAGVMGLTACNSESTTVTTTTASSSAAAVTPSQTPSSTTSEPSATQTSTTESSTTESSTTESTSAATDSSTSTEAASSATGSGGDAAGLTPDDAQLKMGDTATIKDDTGTYKLTVESLSVAPDSAYTEGSLKKSDGTVYFLKYKVEPVTEPSTSFTASSINGLFLRPFFDSSRTGKRMYGSVTGCDSSSDKLSVGQSGSGCYIYQVPGAKITSVTYDDYTPHHILWK